jgi:hypothetical protein
VGSLTQPTLRAIHEADDNTLYVAIAVADENWRDAICEV